MTLTSLLSCSTTCCKTLSVPRTTMVNIALSSFNPTARDSMLYPLLANTPAIRFMIPLSSPTNTEIVCLLTLQNTNGLWHFSKRDTQNIKLVVYGKEQANKSQNLMWVLTTFKVNNNNNNNNNRQKLDKGKSFRLQMYKLEATQDRISENEAKRLDFLFDTLTKLTIFLNL